MSIMKSRRTEKTSYKISEFYRKQSYEAVINRDPATLSWSWKGHIDFEDGPYSKFTSRRNFTTGSLKTTCVNSLTSALITGLVHTTRQHLIAVTLEKIRRKVVLTCLNSEGRRASSHKARSSLPFIAGCAPAAQF